MITADWHLGRNRFNLDFLPFQEKLLMEWLLPLAEKADLLVVAGDIFDAKHPSSETLNVFSRFAAALADRKVQAVFVAGNHDLPELVVYMQGILSRHGLFSVSSAGWSVERAVLPGVPDLVFLPHMTRFDLSQHGVDSVEEMIARLGEHFPPEEKVLITHLTVLADASGGEADSDWEMGLVPSVPETLFRQWKLAVSGHLHGHHTVGQKVVYPGSLLKYHSREVHQTKTVLQVDTKTGSWTREPIPQILDMVLVKGYMQGGRFLLEERLSRESLQGKEAILARVVLTRPGSDLRTPHAVQETLRETLKVDAVYFGGVERVEGQTTEETPTSVRSIEGLSPRDLALRYLEEKNILEALDRNLVCAILDEALARMKEGGDHETAPSCS
uniref:Hypothetical conserved protein n=1 Tax=uncultured Acidobacteriota bacterium TaxID=171953 RepID=H5SCJ8_9BACT|nr:hypothetical conserved protein [uncultured Acidobacteriota bacterium]